MPIVRGALGLALLALAPLDRALTQAPSYDVLITGGDVVDGTGGARFRADVAVRGERIVAVSRRELPRDGARRVIDARGKVVAPGFIDLHAHLEGLPQMPDAESHVRQGVTTALGGPDGGGPWPFGAYLDRVGATGLGLNVGYLAGHNTIRRQVLGTANRAPSPAELTRMQSMVAQAMGEGAYGLSTGLLYVPGNYADISEVIALARAAGDSSGIYTSHLRAEGLGLLDGVREAITIGREAGIPVVLTHHKAVGSAMRGKSVNTLAMIDSARASGLDVMADQYPYTATSTGLGVLVPQWAQANGDSAFARRVADPVLRDSIIQGIVFLLENDRGGGDLRRVQFSAVRWKPDLEGRTLHDWVVERGLPTTPRAAADLIIEGMLAGGASMIYHVLHEDDVRRIMRHPWTAIASDGRLSRPGLGVPHPRAYGTFPRVLGRYVRDLGTLTLEDAVRKMTGLPASRMGLDDRGRVVEGMMADLVVFDPAIVADRATFAEPHQYPAGIDYVVVNGQVTVDKGAMTTIRAGRVLRHQARPRSAETRPSR
jgi:dihydroorotase/N-acyl-D-amino-acid deacylase